MAAVDFRTELHRMGEDVRAGARKMALMSSVQKNRCLEAIAAALQKEKDTILQANAEDLKNARANELSPALLDRLELTSERIDKMAKGLRALIGLEDPVGREEATWLRPNGLKVRRVRVPIGVVAMIYEARPNVTVDAAGLCLKSGNAVFLRGGSESINSNKTLADVMIRGGEQAGLPPGSIQLVPWTDHEAVDTMLGMNDYIDLIIPRGGEGLIRRVAERSTIPVIKHYKGVCHIYVDKDADQQMALDVITNAKCQRPGVCNAAETVLIHNDIAEDFAPRLAKRLADNNVSLRGDKRFCELVSQASPASAEDWTTEYLDLVLTVGVVDSLNDAVEHIATYGSAHSDGIITRNKQAANTFTQAVDSAAVYVNASTRFTDGGEFGMGAEIGVSTDHIHARGPMGLEELTTYKYIVTGNGQVRE